MPTARVVVCTRRAWTEFRSSAPTCATKPRSQPPSSGRTPSSMRSPPTSKRGAYVRGGARARRQDTRTGGGGCRCHPLRPRFRYRRRSRVFFSVHPCARTRRTRRPAGISGVTIVRPSAMFGPGDALFGTIAQLARLLPVLPLIGGGRTRCNQFMWRTWRSYCAHSRRSWDDGPDHEFAGPTVYTLRELFIIALRIIGKWRLLVPVPFAAAEFQARLFEFLPNPPLTSGQVDLLKADNVASGTLPGLPDPKSCRGHRSDRADLPRPVALRRMTICST